MAQNSEEQLSNRAEASGGGEASPAPYGEESLPHGEDIEEFGAPHDYGYKPTAEDLRAPDYVAEGGGDADRPDPIEKASGGQSNADLAADSAPGDRRPGEDLAARQDQLLDEAIEESFPASDPISPKIID